MFTGFVQHTPLQHGQDVEQGHLVQLSHGGQFHIVVGDILPGEHTVEGAVLARNGDGRVAAFLLQRFPGTSHGDTGAQQGRRVIGQIPHLCKHIGNMPGRLEAEAIQNQLGLVGNTAKAGGDVFPVAAGVAQGGIGHRRHDGVGVGVSVACYIDRVHHATLLFRDFLRFLW